ncbi:glycosyltransferase [Acetivibrio straminisolvens JCM 21531]|uniref:Glycosyltransferase n=1 Tax=Acetivibrio straminisolvens JCM 21531 TaxID=1294263 RepID=W4V7Y9_9FIRM|nr:glycosyltransferase [Acetivibrio straminisolvens JCM 21531]
MIVAAHNEEAVIAHIVDSLFRQNYPRNLFDVFVIADNCTDRTAEIAEEHGAIVYRRINNSARGKGYAWSGCLKKYTTWEKNMMQ